MRDIARKDKGLSNACGKLASSGCGEQVLQSSVGCLSKGTERFDVQADALLSA